MRNAGCGTNSRYAVAGVCVAAALACLAGCEEKASKRAALSNVEIERLTLTQEPDRPDRLIVCGETITWQDVLATLPDEAVEMSSLKGQLEKAAQDLTARQFLEACRPLVHQRLINRIESVVLAKQAERELSKTTDVKLNEKLDEYAKEELHRFTVEEHGGNSAEADAALQAMGMTRVSYMQWQKKQILAKNLILSKYTLGRPITYGEIATRYEQMKDSKFAREGTLQLRLIEIRVDKVGSNYPQADAATKAREVAEDLRQQVDGGADFAELARKHSDGLRSEEGGLWRPRDPNSLMEPYDRVAKAALGMNVGQVAGPIETPGRFFLVKLEEKQGRTYQPLSEVQDAVRQDIEEARWRQMLDQMKEGIRQQANLANTDPFVDYCLERFYRQARANG
jgi:parvulin-like peptidyl-prolyl isomerase